MLKVNPVEGGFEIEKVSGEKLVLSPKELIDLLQVSHLLKNTALAELQMAPGLPIEALTPVSRVSLNQDIHKQELHLGMADQNNVFVHYAVPLAIVELLIEKLPKYRDEMMKSSSEPRH
jgi:hypothetical protein